MWLTLVTKKYRGKHRPTSLSDTPFLTLKCTGLRINYLTYELHISAIKWIKMMKLEEISFNFLSFLDRSLKSNNKYDIKSHLWLIEKVIYVATHMTSQIRHNYNHKRLHTTDSEWIVWTTIVRCMGAHAKRTHRITTNYVQQYKSVLHNIVHAFFVLNWQFLENHQFALV